MCRTCWIACAILVAAGPAAAAPASLHVALDVSGTGQIDLWLKQPPSDPEALERGLAAALGGPLTQIRREALGFDWHLAARCPGAGVRRGLAVEGRLDPRPLTDLLRRAGYQELEITLVQPGAAFNWCSLRYPDEGDDLLQATYWDEFDIRRTPPPVVWSFGYRLRDVARFAPLLVLLLLPSALTLFRRWRARRHAEDDAGAAWYSQWWFHRRLVVLTWAGWIAACLLLGVLPFVNFLMGGLVGPLLPFAVAVGACLPVAALGTAKVLAHPLFGAVPEVGWTRAVLIRQVVLGQLSILLPAAATSAAVAAFLADRRLLGALLVLAAVFGGLIGLGAWMLSLGWARTPLPKGELRDRVFELAVHAGVRVRQVYILPAARWRLVNVFAAPGHNVHVADALLRHLSKREIDALLAHELAYLWRLRVRSLWFPFALIGTVVGIGLLAACALVWLGPTVGGWVLAAPLLAGLGLASLLRGGLRRFAPSTDAQAAAVTGDAEALITALAKVARLGLLPLHSPRRPRDCPANAIPLERLERIADEADIPPERLDEILRHPATGSETYPPLDAATEPNGPGPKPFASESRAGRTALAWTNLAVAVVVPGLTAYAASELAVPGGARWLLYAAGVAVAVGFRYLAARVFAIRLTLRLRGRLSQALAAEGIDAAAAGGVFIGIAPDPYPRVYDGYFDWDVGFLFVGSDVLCYAGERARFALRRPQVTDIRLGPGHPAWRRYERIYVEWQAEDGTDSTLNLHPSDVHSLWRSGTPERELAARLRDWWQEPDAVGEVPAALAGLPPPHVGPVPSVSPRELIRPGQAVVIAVVVLALAGVLAAALGLPTDPAHLGALVYALLVPPALEVVALLPYLGYRDPVAPDRQA